MKLIYMTEDYTCHENMKDILTYVSNIDLEMCKKYAYSLIKQFAIQNNQMYLESNLLELMNKISQEERG